MSKQDESIKGQIANIEILESNLKKLVLREINIVTAQLKGSILDDDGMDADKKQIIEQVTMKLQLQLDRKVDKDDFREFLTNKTSKKEHEMTLRMVNLLHQ